MKREFLLRFLLHILPQGFVRIRHIVDTFFTNKLEPRDAATAIAIRRRIRHSPGASTNKSEEWLLAAGTNFDGYPVRTRARALRHRSLPARMRASLGLEGSGIDES